MFAVDQAAAVDQVLVVIRRLQFVRQMQSMKCANSCLVETALGKVCFLTILTADQLTLLLFLVQNERMFHAE